MRKVADMIAEANEEIEVISAEDAVAMKDRDDVTFLDIRDIRELWRDGKIEGAQHAPRGMLEFWVDPHSPYYKDRMFPEGNKYVFY